MDLLALIAADEERDLRLRAAFHGIALEEHGSHGRVRAANRSHSHLERMKARRARGGH